MMPDMRITWTCTGCGTQRIVNARLRHLGDRIGLYKPLGWIATGAGKHQPAKPMCPTCRPPLEPISTRLDSADAVK